MKWNGFECKQFVPVQKLDSTPVYTCVRSENRNRLDTGLFCQPSTTYSTKAIFFSRGQRNGSLFACLGQVNIITGKETFYLACPIGQDAQLFLGYVYVFIVRGRGCTVRRLDSAIHRIVIFQPL